MAEATVIGRIQRELTMVVGPLAPMIMRDKAAELGMSIEDFPEDRMAELVEEVSFEIQNSRRKVGFQRAALEILREITQRPVVPEKSSGLKVRRERKR